MLNFVMSLLVVSIAILPTTSLAQTKCDPAEREACKEAIKEADNVIKLQGDLLTKLASENESLQDENEQLAAALEQVKDIYDSEIKSNLVIGGAGILLGILVGVLIPK